MSHLMFVRKSVTWAWLLQAQRAELCAHVLQRHAHMCLHVRQIEMYLHLKDRECFASVQAPRLRGNLLALSAAWASGPIAASAGPSEGPCGPWIVTELDPFPLHAMVGCTC